MYRFSDSSRRQSRNAQPRRTSSSASTLRRRAWATVLFGALPLLALAVALSPSSASAQQAPPQPVGQTEPVPAGSSDIGPAPSSIPLNLDVVLAPQNPAALSNFIAELYDPSSPEYHQYLAPGQFGPMFGATQQTVDNVSSTLSSMGLSPGPVTSDDLTIPVATTVGQAESAFGIQIHSYHLSSGATGYANTSAPQVPSSISPNITDILGLSDLVQATHFSTVGSDTSSDQAAPTQALPSLSGPTPCSSASSVPDALTANQFASAYSFTTGYSAGDLGSGQTVAIAELEPFASTDISAYESCYGISTTVTTTNVDGGPGTGVGSGESALDIEDVAGLAPDATIKVYQAPNSSLSDLYDVYHKIETDDIAKVVSSSWGQCEALVGSSFAKSEEPVFEAMDTQGQTIVVAAGDTGSSECFRADESSELNVLDVSSDPYVTGVGGTKITSLSTPPSEVVWNESSLEAGAGGGGISEIWQMPSYQKAIGINSDSSGTPCGASAGSYCREVPDVSADADPYSGYAVYYDGGWTDIGGTSAAAPLWAAFVTIVNEGCTSSSGFLNPSLYTHASDLNDITSGNNDYTPSGYDGGLYPATTGYDMASGIGTPNAKLFQSGVLCSTGAPSGPATKLAFTTNPPANVPRNIMFPVAVSVESATGAVVTSSSAQVTLAISGGPPTPTRHLTCIPSIAVDASSGVARFSCSVNLAGTGYRLVATSPGLAGATSTTFTINS